MRIAIAWYSRTGTTARAVRESEAILEGFGHSLSECRILPRFDLPYPLWLALSFFPGSRFPVKSNAPQFAGVDACLLAVPKWTFSCPPLNGFLAGGRKLPPTAVLVTCGGWDQERYLNALCARLARSGAAVLGGTALKRKRIEAGEGPAALETFLRRCFPPEKEEPAWESSRSE